MSIISANNLSKKFKDLTAVDGVSFSVDEGESALAIWKWPWIVRWNRIFKLL